MKAIYPKSGDIREQIKEAIHQLDHVLPGQAPIRDFVHHNTLHGYQHLPFPEAVASARRLTGANGYMPLEKFRDSLRQGRITVEDLAASIDEETTFEPDGLVTDSLRRRDIYLAFLTMPYQPLSGSQLNWQVEENHVLEKLRSDLPNSSRARLLKNAQAEGLDTESAAVTDLWNACLEILRLEQPSPHPEELFDMAPEQAEMLLHDLFDFTKKDRDAPNTTTQMIQQSAHERLSALFDRIGCDMTMRDLLLGLTGQDILEDIRPLLIKDLSNFLDQGVASWQPTNQNEGFYSYWCGQIERDPNWQLQGLEGWRQHLELLESDPLETIISELHRLGLNRERWTGYLKHLALEIPGWSGMVQWRQNNPGYNGLFAQITMLDYLAVRLVLERIYSHNLCAHLFNIESSFDVLRWYFRHQAEEFTVREALFNTPLPEYLASRAQRALHAPKQDRGSQKTSPWQHLAQLIWTWRQISGNGETNTRPTLSQTAWPLFQLAQQLGWCGAEVRTLSDEQIHAIFRAVDSLDDDRMGYIWLCAYEKHYRDQILTALAQNQGRGAWPNREARPAAQLVFCMDDREEGTRRHLEEIYPEVETLGTAAHFNVPHNWRGLDDICTAAQSPVIPTPVIPVHEVRERPASNDKATGDLHQRRHRWLRTGHQFLLQHTRLGLVLPILLATLAAPTSFAVLIGKILAPRLFGQLLEHLKQLIEKPLTTRITYTAPNDSPEATQQRPRVGFTDIEQADRVQALLQGISLVAGFAQLVVIIGHGSRNQNNPHASAYNCGACSGHFSGPNARVAAAMANRSEVRTLLAERDIVIPEDTWFIGAEHDTCNEVIDWYDLDLLPSDRVRDQIRLQQALEQATRLHAQERCRRLASAPTRPSPQRAFDHINGRSLDFSQARPELGHATNACAFIGRRAMSRGVFFDRRAFLISYDTTQDPTGELLERHLMTNGAVGAGINLEYYFSTVDNERYGCGSKVTHNVTGFLGVMEGASSDLRTGLPRQMIEIHEAMRLLVIVEASTESLTMIYNRQPPLQELVGNAWVQLVTMDPNSGEFHLFDPKQGWIQWQADGKRLPMVNRSTDWYLGSVDPLPPALIRSAEESAADA